MATTIKAAPIPTGDLSENFSIRTLHSTPPTR